MGLTERSNQIVASATEAFRGAKTEVELFQLKARYLGKKGELTALLKEIRNLPPDQRRTTGADINEAKRALEGIFGVCQGALKSQALASGHDSPLDVSLPGRGPWGGHLHPVMIVWQEICDIFSSMGFVIKEGPQVETEWHNFEALNIPQGHPAREMQDTFFVREGIVLRTHTSPVQVRTMLDQPPPIRMICPGVVYRRDSDNTHTPMFHQVEGLVVDDRTTMADLKGMLAEFARAFFGPQTEVRFRASYFPFTEPSAEVDVSCPFCPASGGCRVCKDTQWIEILGCGMVDPAVFSALDRDDYDPEQVQGYAFGMGIDRMTMLRYGINDLRLLFDNDLRLLEQFSC